MYDLHHTFVPKVEKKTPGEVWHYYGRVKQQNRSVLPYLVRLNKSRDKPIGEGMIADQSLCAGKVSRFELDFWHDLLKCKFVYLILEQILLATICCHELILFFFSLLIINKDSRGKTWMDSSYFHGIVEKQRVKIIYSWVDAPFPAQIVTRNVLKNSLTCGVISVRIKTKRDCDDDHGE